MLRKSDRLHNNCSFWAYDWARRKTKLATNQDIVCVGNHMISSNNLESISRSKFIQTLHSVKTTAYDQNNKMQWCLHTFKAQKSSKSGSTVQGIV